MPACRRPGRLPGRRCRDAGHDLVDRPTQDVDMVTPDPSEAVTYLDGPLRVTGIHSPVVPFEEVKNLHRRFHLRRSESADRCDDIGQSLRRALEAGVLSYPQVFHLPRESSNSMVTAYGGADSPAPEVQTDTQGKGKDREAQDTQDHRTVAARRGDRRHGSVCSYFGGSARGKCGCN